MEKIDDVKENPDLVEYLENPKCGDYLIDLVDWLSYVYNGAFLNRELINVRKEYEALVE